MSEKSSAIIPKASAANGRVCCILDLACCIPPGGATIDGARKLALAQTMQKICSTLSAADALEIAEGLLSEFDLVPAGVGQAIAQGYARWIKKPIGDGTPRDLPELSGLEIA